MQRTIERKRQVCTGNTTSNLLNWGKILKTQTIRFDKNLFNNCLLKQCIGILKPTSKTLILSSQDPESMT